MKFDVLNYVLLDVPVHEAHARGKNWAAVIDVDGKSPGGVSRRWLPRARGEGHYIIDQLALFDAVEFAADYVQWSGKTLPKRWYGVVTSIKDTAVFFTECKSASDAVLLAKKKREKAREKAVAS